MSGVPRRGTQTQEPDGINITVSTSCENFRSTLCNRGPHSVLKPPMRNEQFARDAILAAITTVTHYEDRTTGRKVSLNEAQHLPRSSLRSVGLPYCECLELVKERVPWSKAKAPVLRWAAHQVRSGAPGFQGYELPQKRAKSAL